MRWELHTKVHMIGSTIGHYTILEKLGEGGMGVVYKAHDTKLDRDVALKFLPHQLTATADEQVRFLQEARAASALNHPNICTIHAIEEQDGQQFIVMEYVDGKMLSQLVPIQKTQTAIEYAIQIGDALQEAHGKGVVHRNIKTDNIMVNAKNQVKVMDFGLAKLKGSLRLTKTSSTVGTLAYIAPEQLQGGEVDARSDIFSFGVVLFEMLTGRLPFRGEHDAAMMYSILNEEPESLQKHLPDATPELVHVLDRALEKDPGERYQTANDMLIDLRRIKKRTSRVTRVAPAAQAVAPSAPEGATELPEKRKKGPGSRRAVWIVVSVAVACIAALVLFVLLPRKAVELNPDMTFRALPIPFTEVVGASLSHDGNWMAFRAADANKKWDVYFMNTTSGESRRLTSDSSTGFTCADLSADASQIVYDRYNGSTRQMEIVIVSTVGTSNKKIVDKGFFPKWRSDGERIGYVRDKQDGSSTGKAEFWTIKPNGTDNRCELVDSLSSQRDEYTHPMFAWSPDGQSICWVRHYSPQHQEVEVYDLSTKHRRQVTSDNKEIGRVCWAPNNQILYSSNKTGNYNLWMVPASGGASTQITKGAGPDNIMAISRDGSKLLYRQQQVLSHIWIGGTDGSNVRQLTFDDIFLWRVAFSPDGKEIVFASGQPLTSRGTSVCSIDRNGKNRKELIFVEGLIGNPVPSPDGRWIVYGGSPLDEPIDSMKVYLIDAKNPGTPRLLCRGCPFNWLDEKTFTVALVDSEYRTWLGSIEGGEPRKYSEDSTFATPLLRGKYIGYDDARFDRRGLWICAAPGVKDPSLPSPKRLVEGHVPYGEFDKNGKFFYCVRNAGELRRISITSGREEIVRGVFPGLNPDFEHSTFDISYDGKDIVYTEARFDSRLVMIEHPFK
jgi:Tol biopolymer transport system component/predicted Ser/Thr protein kinase